MSPTDRRSAILAVTLPLLQELGANVTTSQIAHAAGIAEGTIFRVFEDKHELLLAASRAAMRGDDEIDQIQRIPLDTPLPKRLAAALTVLGGYQDRLWALMRVFRNSGWRPDHEQADGPDEHPAERIAGALAALFEPERENLRLEARAAARLLLGLSFTNRMHEPGLGEPSATATELVDLFLNGALKH